MNFVYSAHKRTPFVPRQLTDLEVKCGITVQGNAAVFIPLPRRSVYIMSGSSRVDWMHGIQVFPKNRCPTRAVVVAHVGVVLF